MFSHRVIHDRQRIAGNVELLHLGTSRKEPRGKERSFAGLEPTECVHDRSVGIWLEVGDAREAVGLVFAFVNGVRSGAGCICRSSRDLLHLCVGEMGRYDVAERRHKTAGNDRRGIYLARGSIASKAKNDGLGMVVERVEEEPRCVRGHWIIWGWDELQEDEFVALGRFD